MHTHFNYFRNMAIRKKILTANFLTCIMALVVAFTAFIVNETITVKSALEKDLDTQAEVIARGSAATTLLKDTSTATELMYNSLQFKPNIVHAYFLTDTGRILASYHNDHFDALPQSSDGHFLKKFSATGNQLDGKILAQLRKDYLEARRPINVDGKVLGTVVLYSDLSPVYERLNIYIRNAILIILLALAIAYLLSTRLAERISRPLLNLTEEMTKVARTKDYSLRAEKISNDDVGTLIDQFNGMLARIEERDELLRQRGEHLEQLAHFDTLTGLPNRLLIIDRLEQAISHAASHDEKIAVMFIDIDNFKDINDTLGHRIGDQLLKEFGTRLRNSIRGSDNVGRLGGDEFVVFVTESKMIDNVAIMVQRLVEGFNAHFVLEETELFVTASIGVTLFPLDGFTVEDLLKNADMAMYSAKESGENHYHFFSNDMQQRATQRLELHSGLRRGLDRGEFFLVYQPTVNLETSTTCGFEALLRWRSPEKGIIPPLDFITIAEETGLIVPLGEWVIREVCRQIRCWQNEGLQPLRVAVNVSPVQLKKQNLAEKMLAILEETGTDPCYLGIEITESSLVMANDETIKGLWSLKNKGVRILIDDFGTGYSSLGYLRRIPLDALKVDRSFIANSMQNHEDKIITKAILGLGRNLTLSVVGEGVETEDQLDFLRQHGCNEAQGYLFSRPILPDECKSLMAATFPINAAASTTA